MYRAWWRPANARSMCCPGALGRLVCCSRPEAANFGTAPACSSPVRPVGTLTSAGAAATRVRWTCDLVGTSSSVSDGARRKASPSVSNDARRKDVTAFRPRVADSDRCDVKLAVGYTPIFSGMPWSSKHPKVQKRHTSICT